MYAYHTLLPPSKDRMIRDHSLQDAAAATITLKLLILPQVLPRLCILVGYGEGPETFCGVCLVFPQQIVPQKHWDHRRARVPASFRYSFSIGIAKSEPSTVVGCSSYSPYAAAETAAPESRLVRNEGSCKGIPRNKRPSLVDIKLPYGEYLKIAMVALMKCNVGYIGFLIHALHAVRLQ